MVVSGDRFVTQEHHARMHHFDFRLERDWMLKSWAVPKGLPDAVGVKRLAIQVEAHALEFGDFEGTIPPVQYRAGEIRVWDSGTSELLEWTEEHIRVRLRGSRTAGVFEILKFRHGKRVNG
jgi:bifunctional non-homologous end joining protein LigD